MTEALTNTLAGVQPGHGSHAGSIPGSVASPASGQSQSGVEPPQSKAASAANSVQWTEHPVVDSLPEFRRLSDEEFTELASGAGVEAALEYYKAREKRIADSKRDPFRYEFPLLHWADLEGEVLRHIVTFVPGGNNPGKSRWAASLVARVLMRKVSWPDLGSGDGKVKILMVAQDDGASKMFQQDKVYAQLPAEWRSLNESVKKPAGFAKAINYSDKNGFTEATMVLPRPLRGQVWFRTVAQYLRDPNSFEGPDYDLVVIDEGCPLPLFNALKGRVAKRGGKIVYLLTCVHGYDLTMGQALAGASLVKALPMQFVWGQKEQGGLDVNRATSPRPSPPEAERVPGGLSGQLDGGYIEPTICFPELKLNEHQTDFLKRLGCPAGFMPYKLQPLNPQWRVVFMWNTWNPFQPRAKWCPPVPGATSPQPSPPLRGGEGDGAHGVTRPTSGGLFWGKGSLPAQMDSCVGDPKWRVLVKMFGWVERIGQLALGNFNPEVHVIRGEQREALDRMVREGKASVFMASDPETQRSHFILWQATFAPCPQWPNGLKYLFDESPRMNEGEWVNGQNERGEGQYVYKATGANWYKRYIRTRELDWNICDELVRVEGRGSGVEGKTVHACVLKRRGDPRGFATEESTATGTRSLFDLYQEDHSAEHPLCGPMIFEPAKIRRASSLDIDVLIDLFRYDEERYSREGGFTAENTPARLVSDRCENWIRCALNYTLTDLGKADEDNPNRDPIDADRYLNSGDTPWIDAGGSNVSGGGGMG